MDITRVLDATLQREAIRLREITKKQGAGIRSAAFANAYVFEQSQCLALTRVSSCIYSGMTGRPDSEDGTLEIEKRIRERDLTPGQMLMVLSLCRMSRAYWPAAATLVARALVESWRQAPYHLRLALVDAAGYRRDSAEEERSAIASALEGILASEHPLLGSLIVDVLGRLGALESSEREQTPLIRDRLTVILATAASEESHRSAEEIYRFQFDHPYSTSYCEAVTALGPEEHRAFLKMALAGSEEPSLALSPLIAEASGLGDRGVCNHVCRWLGVPEPDCTMPQEAVDVFVVAHVALGRLGCSLPAASGAPASAAAAAFQACGEALYWANRRDLTEAARRAEAAASLRVLTQCASGAALSVLRACALSDLWGRKQIPAGDDVYTSLAHYFPTETALICRIAVAHPDEVVEYFRGLAHRDRHAGLEFAFAVLAEHGDVGDLEIMRRFSDDQRIGRSAVQAILGLEGRLRPS